MPTFRVRIFLILVGFAAFTLLFCSVGIRWHTYRVRAALHAQRELDHTFKAADFARAARVVGDSPDDRAQALRYKMIAEMHERAALENTRLRELYENCW